MNETLTFAGRNSRTYGIYISGESVYNAPERVVEMISVPGRSGDIAMDEGRFENITVEYPAFLWGTNRATFTSKMHAMRSAFLSTVGYQRLEDDYHPNEYRLGVYMSGLEAEPKMYNTAAEFTLSFNCKPYRYLKSGETARVFTGAGTITNPEAFASLPLLVVTGYGVLGIGSKSLTIQGTSTTQEIYIDCDTMEAWEMVGGVMIARNDYVQNAGDAFPVLEPGDNGIALDTTMSRIEITPRWRTI